ncbi:MAG: DUF503 domain-containing protein [Syntrophomonadaceae bacterium]|nr:DUF503 domain-containing protein [Syntrophomonadaceae bacterium]
MYVLYSKAEIYLPYATSLKDKRQIVQSLTDRMRKRFSISVAEVDHHDLWQRASIGFAAVCKSVSETDLIMETIRTALDGYSHQFEVLDLNWEIASY